MIKKLLFLLTLLISLSISAKEYNLEDLIDYALENSYPVLNAEYYSDIAASSLREDWMALLPDSNIRLRKIYDYENLDYKCSDFSFYHRISINDYKYFEVISSSVYNDNAKLQLAQQKKDTAFNVLKLYLAVIIAQSETEIFRQNLELQQNITKQTEIMYENGKASLLDIQQSRISALDYSIMLRNAELAYSDARSDLFTFINIIDDGSDFSICKFNENSDLAEYVCNIELEKRSNLVKNSKFKILESKLDFLPDISLNYNLNHNTENDITKWEGFYRSSNYLTLELNFDIFSLAAKRETYLQNKFQLNIAENGLEDYQNFLKNEVKILREEIKNKTEERELYKQKLQLAEDNLRLAQTQYDLGTIGLLDLNSAVISLSEAKLQENRSMYDYIQKREELNNLLSLPVLGKW